MSALNGDGFDRQRLAEQARRWNEAGFAVVPVRTDGSKRPDLPEWASMATQESAPPSIESVVARILGGRNDGIGLLMGAASGSAEMLEIEGRAMDRYVELEQHARHTGVDHLLNALLTGCTERTPSGGLHAYLRVSDGPALGNTVFAKRPRSDGEEKDPVLAESRGQGGFSVCAPSGGRTHETGKPYEFIAGGPETVPVFTAEERDLLHDLLRFLDEMPHKPEPFSSKEQARVPDNRDQPSTDDLLPGDDLNRRAAWDDILVGWTRVYASGEGTPDERTHWRRPGKTNGTSATTGGEGDWLYVFSTSTELPPEKALSKFAVYAYLHHGGNFSAAAEDLARQGYGSRKSEQRSGKPVISAPYQPFPTDALPEPLRAFVEAGGAAAGCDPALIALPALAALASAIGNARRLLLKRSWKVPPNLWTLTVAESGSQKSVGYRMALAPIEERQRQAIKRQKQQYQAYELELAEWERGRSEWKKNKIPGSYLDKPEPPVTERFVVSDTTVEALATILQNTPRGLLLARDELKGWIGSFDRYAANGKSKADEAHWLTMYNGGSLLVDRKTVQTGTIFVPSASVSITGGIPPGSLRQALGTQHRESGLAARLLMAFPPRRAKVWTDETIPFEVERAYANLFDRLYSLEPETITTGEPRPIDADLSPEAKDLFTWYFNQHNEEQVGLAGDIAAVWSKLEETVARLALVLHYVRWAGGDPEVIRDTIDDLDVALGILLVNWFKNEAIRIYAMLDQTEPQQEASRLLEWLQKRGGGATVREVQQGCRWLRGSGQAEAALNALAGAGHGTWASKPGQPAGKKVGRFVLTALGGQPGVGA
jgi:hypothetical protein